MMSVGQSWTGRGVFFLFSLVLLFASSPLRAQVKVLATAVPSGTVPDEISYQGRLMQNGYPVTGTEILTFYLYDAPTGGNVLWQSGPVQVQVSQGVFGTSLNISTSALAGPAQKYIETDIETTPLLPRQALLSVPYALMARNIEGNLTISTVSVTGTLTSTGTIAVSTLTAASGFSGINVTTSVFVLSGSLGIGTASPAQSLDIVGTGGGTAGIHLSSAVPGNTNMTLYNNSGSLYWNGGPLALGSSVSGTTGQIPEFTSPTSLGNSIMNATASSVTVEGALTSSSATVTGFVSAESSVTAGTGFYGSGVGLTNVPGSSLTGNISASSAAIANSVTASVVGVSSVPAAGNLFAVGASTFVVNQNGNVGIGTASPTNPLSVSGNANVTGTLTAGAFSGVGAVPSGAVMFFNLSSCPSGWTALAAAQGRYLVGLPSGGALAGTDGTALSNLEDRPAGHITDTVNDPGHSHSINDPGHSHSINDPGHSHVIYGDTQYGGGGGRTGEGIPTAVGNCQSGNCIYVSGSAQTSTTGITINSATTGISINSAKTGISVTNNSSSVVGTPAPYLQLLVCQKN